MGLFEIGYGKNVQLFLPACQNFVHNNSELHSAKSIGNVKEKQKQNKKKTQTYQMLETRSVEATTTLMFAIGTCS